MTRFSTMFCRAILLAAVILIPALLRAQSPRMVVMEECTNASCGPCAAQNPFYEAYLALPHNQKMVIPICYHASYPGSDVMNAANPTMHNGRVTYYSNTAFTPYVTGVPTVMVNGIVPNRSPGAGYDGAPSDTVALHNSVMAAQGMSPITITIKETRNGTASDVSVTVVSTQNIPGKTLQIAVVENHHYYASAGTNGEKDFVYIPRQMLPSQTGTPVSLVAGTPQTFNQSYTMNSAWNAGEVYIVAFVQDDNTHEVLQGADNKGRILAEPAGALTRVQTGTGQTADWQCALSTNIDSKCLVNITTKMPATWKAGLQINSSAVKDGDSVALSSVTPSAMNVQFDLSGSTQPGKGSVTVTIHGMNGATSTTKFKLYSKGADVLVCLKDEGLATIETAHDKAMAVTTRPYLLVDNGDESLFTWKDYKVVVFEVGKNIVDQKEVDALKQYMDAGGRLYLTGAEIAWGLADPGAATAGYYADLPFVQNYLHADYVGDTGPSFQIYGMPGDPVCSGMNFFINNGVPNQDTPDEIKSRTGAQPICYYGSPANNRVAGIRFANSTYRLVYLGFGIEGIKDPNVAGSLLGKGIDWLLASDLTGVNDQAATGATALGTVVPNPSTNAFEASFTLASRSHVALRLYDVQGRMVATVAEATFQAGRSTVRCSTTDLPAGVYSLVMTAAGASSTRMVTVVH